MERQENVTITLSSGLVLKHFTRGAQGKQGVGSEDMCQDLYIDFLIY